MKRRRFVETIGMSSGLFFLDAIPIPKYDEGDLRADLVITGGGLGGTATAIAALRNGLRVILTEETDWLGGQISQQGVPPDEHAWIETHGAPASYREYRNGIRAYYKNHYPLTSSARSNAFLNPGNGAVSRICCEPRVAHTVLMQTLAPYLSTGQLKLLLEHKLASAEVDGDRVEFIQVIDLGSGDHRNLEGTQFVDATELGDLLPLTGTEYVTGSESKQQTKELHAAEKADPENHQAFTMCFAMDYVPHADLTIDRPENYSYWSNLVPDLTPPWADTLIDLNYSNPKTLGPKELGFHPEGIPTGDMLNLWNYRRIIHRDNFLPGTYDGDITIVNWPQNDYFLGNLTEGEVAFNKHVEQSKQLNLSLFYWLQTEAPRPDGGAGWPGLRLRGDVMGTTDGMAKYPYVRESRRIEALFTIKEEHVGKENRKMVSGEDKAAVFDDSVGIGYYHIDLHPSSGGNNYIDFASLPFQIPLGALIPRRMKNVLPANKNIGTTHITNGCYRLHPVEWSIGEAVGVLAAKCIDWKVQPAEIYHSPDKLKDLQSALSRQGIELEWP
ncbi:MAG: FAD-dependent oxidoreductase [Saprospiraceae bacterium]|nr:FAD-dependent oxidoreductase [Saprospiraceae bacterium]